ncbi:MAG: triple tyrosine motif-containing protein, partial [Marinilabilia sp.]
SHSGAYSITRVPDRPDHLVQSTYTDLVLYNKENGEWNYSSTIAGFSDLINSVEFDQRGNLWASHLYRGIYQIRLNDALDSAEHVNYYGKDSEIWQNGNSLRAFKVESRIVFTDEELLYTYDDLNDSIVPYDSLNENLESYSSSFLIKPGPSNHYWLMNDEGIALFHIRTNNVEKIKEFPMTLFREDLIPREENIVPIDDRKAILCLENGYGILDASAKEAGERITKENLTLREVSASDDAGETTPLSPYKKEITIPFSRNNLSIRYSFPLYSGEEIRYQYKVEGLTEEWSELSEKPDFTINRIPPGDYTVMVRATNNWEKSSAIHEMQLTVKPPWYQSTVAIILYALFFLALFFVGKQITIRRVRLHEKKKREEKEREVIRLRNEKLQSELSFKSRQLANSAMAMAKKNEFLMELKKKLERQKEQLGTRYPDKYYHELIKKIDSNIAGDDEEWKVFEHNFNQAHETFLQTLKNEYPDLTPSDLRLCAFLRINLTSKEIAPLLGISVRGVENHRYRLRKKLGLDAETDLTEFILTWGNGRENQDN